MNKNKKCSDSLSWNTKTGKWFTIPYNTISCLWSSFFFCCCWNCLYFYYGIILQKAYSQDIRLYPAISFAILDNVTAIRNPELKNHTKWNKIHWMARGKTTCALHSPSAMRLWSPFLFYLPLSINYYLSSLFLRKILKPLAIQFFHYDLINLNNYRRGHNCAFWDIDQKRWFALYTIQYVLI